MSLYGRRISNLFSSLLANNVDFNYLTMKLLVQLNHLLEIKALKPLLSLKSSVNEINSLEFLELMELPEDSPHFTSDSFRLVV